MTNFPTLSCNLRQGIDCVKTMQVEQSSRVQLIDELRKVLEKSYR